jgi:hypothetical protein
MTHADETMQAELPPLPAARCISPAVEDYATRSSLPRFLWPIVWLLALVGLAFLLTAHGWHEAAGPAHDDGAPGHATDEHGAPDPWTTEAPGHSESR